MCEIYIHSLNFDNSDAPGCVDQSGYRTCAKIRLGLLKNPAIFGCIFKISINFEAIFTNKFLRPIPFEKVLNILVSIFHLLHGER